MSVHTYTTYMDVHENYQLHYHLLVISSVLAHHSLLCTVYNLLPYIKFMHLGGSIVDSSVSPGTGSHPEAEAGRNYVKG